VLEYRYIYSLLRYIPRFALLHNLLHIPVNLRHINLILFSSASYPTLRLNLVILDTPDNLYMAASYPLLDFFVPVELCQHPSSLQGKSILWKPEVTGPNIPSSMSLSIFHAMPFQPNISAKEEATTCAALSTGDPQRGSTPSTKLMAGGPPKEAATTGISTRTCWSGARISCMRGCLVP